MSFLPLSHSTTSLSTTHSACFTETSDSTGYTSDGRRDSDHCAERKSSVEGGEDEMRKFLLGPGWVRDSALCVFRLDDLNRGVNHALAFVNSMIVGCHLLNA